ncbi:hypothetical protein CK503_15810 [Aliifodinibius salipaludis]|uniref:Uncharacterized protein n=1 Tax=Fodinibius salipaludis TaxID=2032627 RepID=A0A2A2G727_9BACT|nr:hypothetical protein [Aliifodinibius salipaludis]PAU92627.1 hypothetical protein CK503_15810 [Aliifodinibius salipaludis]
MNITIPDRKNASKWVRFINLLNLFLAGVALGQFWAFGYDTPFVMGYFICGPLVAIILDTHFTPKKQIDFPGDIFKNIKDQFSAI